MTDLPLISNVQFDTRALEYIEKKKISNVLIDVEYLEEPCTQIFSPIVKDQAHFISEDKGYRNQQGLLVEFSDQYLNHFDFSQDIIISTEGLLKKHLSVKNIDPIIKNVCKI
ncbi:hypothetical protein [Candidatus Lokiarchaeum ossiferum]|uniref:hypothetical protein n=1 Tax=Candidatus Lokiarchaeum ossiferum TaxID=2951803 RepID=UPI00352F5483